MRRFLILFLAFALSSISAFAQYKEEETEYEKIKPNFTVEGWYASLTNGDRDGASLVDANRNHYPKFNFLLGFQSKPGAKNEAIAEALNYPVYGIGVGWEKFSSMGFNYKDSRLSDMFNLFGFFEGSIYKTPMFSFGLTLRLGVGLTFDIYDKDTNPNNVHFGGPLSLYVCGGPQIKFRPTKQLELAANAFIWHHSNGHTWTPNIGINQRGIGLSARYSLEEPYTRNVKKGTHLHDFKSGFKWDIFTHVGMHSYKSEWFAYNQFVPDKELKQPDFANWSRVGIGASVQHRYCLLCSTGIEVDMTYMWGMKRLEQSDRVLFGDKAVDNSKGYCPVMVTAGAVHEFYYGNVSAYLGIGAYVLHKVGIYEDSTWMYEKIGMRFYVPNWNNIFLGWNILARNFTEADHFEFQLGIRL